MYSKVPSEICSTTNNSDDALIYSNTSNDKAMSVPTSICETLPVKRQQNETKVLQKNKCNVSFSRQIRVKKIRPIHDLVVDINKVWFSSEELYMIRLECWKISEQMYEDERTCDDIDIDQQEKQKQIIENDDNEEARVCMEGLERFTKWGRYLSQMKRNTAVMAVLQEQDFQRSMGIHEPEILASVCKLNSFDHQNSDNTAVIENY